MNVRAIRGAITVDFNEKNDIINSAKELLEEMILKNHVQVDDIISIIFTATPDLDQAYPAVAARELQIFHAGLLCMQEMIVEKSLSQCIRVLMYVNSLKTQKEIKHVYRKGAKVLRPDLVD